MPIAPSGAHVLPVRTSYPQAPARIDVMFHWSPALMQSIHASLLDWKIELLALQHLGVVDVEEVRIQNRLY